MEQYEKVLQKRQVGIVMYNVALIALLALVLLRPAAGDEGMQGFVSGFVTGLFTVAQVVLIMSFIRYRAALKNEDKRKALYIEEHDERKLAIRSKMGGTATQIILFGLLAGTIAAGYYNQTVFFTLLGALLFSALVKAVLKAYYTRKLT